MIKALAEVHDDTTLNLGNGHCTQHFHFGSDLRDCFKKVGIPSPVTMARCAAAEVEATGDIPSFAFIKKDVLAALGDDRKTTATILEDRIDPRALVYLLVTNRTFELLCSGRHHIYRGVLSEAGRQLLTSFSIASDRMITFGLHDHSKHEADLAELKGEIETVG